MHGFNDDIIPYNEESIWCYGLGPRGTLISGDGYHMGWCCGLVLALCVIFMILVSLENVKKCVLDGCKITS